MRAQSVAAALRQAVSAGEYSPGEKLNEVIVAEKMGISRNTLREGFASLAAEGIIDRIPHRGVFIASPTAADVLSLFRARAVVEPGAVLWGTELDVDALDRIVSTAEAAETADVESVDSVDSAAAIALANQEFHRTLVGAAGSALLDEEMDRLLARMRLVFLAVERVRPNLHGDFVAVNRQIVTMLRDGDRDAAAAMLRASLVETGETLATIVHGTR
ncbi:MAG TPA: GntR family transcriptional regulator [Candidatus Corynebacterium faecigallinarum]|uniref:GntR family transcriptional regulator n=1 Tax=Candidatus Corynebacterium faecigallinarum TaxID=2838528 RepID=A0A9D2TPS6_9CORY|nr:GntR family transcriptional regulator [Candidatus Corynebacterium faecigallinarum]